LTNEKEESKQSRLLFLDNIKLLFAILVIFQHTRVTYQGSGWWYYIEAIQPPIKELDILSEIIFQTIVSLGGLLQASLLGLFFLMGGFLTPKSFDRKGAVKFWKERLVRLGIPLLLYIFIINPILYYTLATLDILPWVELTSLEGSLLDYYLYQLKSVSQFVDFITSTGPMWFLYVLLIFSAGYTIWRTFSATDFWKRRNLPNEISIPSKFQLLVLAIILGVGTFLVRINFPIDSFPLGIPVGSMIQYTLMFSIGIIAVQNEWVQQMSKDQIKFWSLIIVGAYLTFFSYFVIFVGFDADLQVFLGGSPPTLEALLFAIVDNIISMGMIFVLIPIFYMRFNTQGPLLRDFSASSFHMYIVHAPILIMVSLVFAPINLFPIFKLVIVLPLTVLFCFLISHFILRKVL